MTHRYLEITFRDGLPIAAYLHLQPRTEHDAARTEELDEGFVADFASDGRVLGLEILAPAPLDLDAVNTVLQRLNERPLSAEEARPLSSRGAAA